MWLRKKKPESTLVVIKREEALVWAKADAAFIRHMLKTESGIKARKILEDAIATSLNGQEQLDKAVLRAEGMTAMLDLIFRLAATNRYTGQEEDLSSPEEDKAFTETTILQEDEE